MSGEKRLGWQIDVEKRTASDFAGHFHPAAVGLDDGAHQAQAEAQSPLRATFIGAVEPVPDFGKLFRSNPHPGVLDSYYLPSLLGDAVTSTLPPAGVYLTALSSRLAMACLRRAASAVTESSEE